jgi:hypothetical protein
MVLKPKSLHYRRSELLPDRMHSSLLQRDDTLNLKNLKNLKRQDIPDPTHSLLLQWNGTPDWIMNS